MKILYWDCAMGAAGDMLAASLLGLSDRRDDLLETLNQAGIPGVDYHLDTIFKSGIQGLHLTVSVHGAEEKTDDYPYEYSHDHSHAHHTHSQRRLEDITKVVSGLRLPDQVRTDVIEVYHAIAAAESRIHGVEVSEIHFHEIGRLDAVADIAAVCLAMQSLAPDCVIASPIHVGSGHVHCVHGILPVPAPATLELLRGIPIYGGTIQGELCTPTGAALLRHFVDQFGPLPLMTVSAFGYGMGYKDFPMTNCVRAIIGNSDAAYDSTIQDILSI